MFDVGFNELLIFLLIALVVLGPEKLQTTAKTAGKWYAIFRHKMQSLQDEFTNQSEIQALKNSLQHTQNELLKLETEFDRSKRIIDQAIEQTSNETFAGFKQNSSHYQGNKSWFLLAGIEQQIRCPKPPLLWQKSILLPKLYSKTSVIEFD